MKYEYYIHSIPVKTIREGDVLEEGYEQSITEFAAQGWRFIQLVNLTHLAHNRRVDLVFEKQIIGGEQ